MSGASERANGQASGPVLTSLFLFIPNHSALALPAAVEGTAHPTITVKPVPVVFAVAIISLGARGLLVANAAVLTGPPIARVAAARRKTSVTASVSTRMKKSH